MAPPSLANEPVAGVNVIALPQSRSQMQDLGGLPLVVLPVEYCLWKMMKAECAEAPQNKIYAMIEITSPEGIFRAIAEWAGLIILSELYVRLKLAGSGLRIIGLYDPVPRHSVRLAYQGNRYLNITTRELGTLCLTTMTRLLARPKHSHRSTVTTGKERGS